MSETPDIPKVDPEKTKAAAERMRKMEEKLAELSGGEQKPLKAMNELIAEDEAERDLMMEEIHAKLDALQAKPASIEEQKAVMQSGKAIGEMSPAVKRAFDEAQDRVARIAENRQKMNQTVAKRPGLQEEMNEAVTAIQTELTRREGLGQDIVDRGRGEKLPDSMRNIKNQLGGLDPKTSFEASKGQMEDRSEGMSTGMTLAELMAQDAKKPRAKN